MISSDTGTPSASQGLLFGETSDKKSLRLLEARILGDGLAYLIYELARDASSD